MDVVQKVPAFCEHLDQMVVKIARMACREADSRNVDFAEFIHQVAESVFHILKIFAVGVDVLSEKRDFFVAFSRKPYTQYPPLARTFVRGLSVKRNGHRSVV